MDASNSIAPDLAPPRGARGFTLVEVTLAIGVVAFAFISIFALVPAGLNSFRTSMETSLGSQIAQRIVQEAQQTGFKQLTGTAAAAATTPKVIQWPVRYFDDQGNELAAPERAIYHVNTVASLPTLQPGTPAVANYRLATLTVQIAHNPGNRPLTPDASTKCWTAAPGVTWFSSHIAQND